MPYLPRDARYLEGLFLSEDVSEIRQHLKCPGKTNSQQKSELFLFSLPPLSDQPTAE